jgi:putative transposase
VYRLYGEGGLAVRCREVGASKGGSAAAAGAASAGEPSVTMDFTHDNGGSGRKFRTLNPMDGFTRQSLRIEVDTSLSGLRVVWVPEAVAHQRGYPQAIQGDNGLDLISRLPGLDEVELDAVLERPRVRHPRGPIFLEPVEPNSN